MASVMGVGLNVQDLAHAESFYVEVLGMKVVARYDVPKFKEAVLSYGDDEDAPSVLLLEWHGHVGPYEHGDAFAKVVLAVDDVHGVCAALSAWNCVIEQAPVHLAKLHMIMAKVCDPDGHLLELVEHAVPGLDD